MATSKHFRSYATTFGVGHVCDFFTLHRSCSKRWESYTLIKLMNISHIFIEFINIEYSEYVMNDNVSFDI